MNRSSVVLVLAAFALDLAGCNAPACGPGTKPVVVQGGGVQCRLVDGLPDSVPCDVDAGAMIVGGQCVSRVSCGANTTYDPATGICTGTGTSAGGLPPCPTPAAGTLCIHGLLHNFVDNSPYTGPDIKVTYYDPQAFLAGGGQGVVAMTMSSMGGYVFPNTQHTVLNYIAIATGDLNDESMFVVAATGDKNVSIGNSYRVDAYVIPRSVTDGWKTQTGVDYLTTGAYVARFFADAPSAVTNLLDNEKTPVAAVQVTDDRNGTPTPTANAQYFSTDLSTIDPTLKMTSMTGTAILPVPMYRGMNVLADFSGQGGMVNGKTPTWESQLGGTAAYVVFVSRFHAM
jgi:hypothetical protein